MIDSRIRLKILGVCLGTASEWDGDDSIYTFYDFEPAPSVSLIACSCLVMNMVSGKVEVFGKDGETILSTHDLLTILREATR